MDHNYTYDERGVEYPLRNPQPPTRQVQMPPVADLRRDKVASPVCWARPGWYVQAPAWKEVALV